jgi:putative transposase
MYQRIQEYPKQSVWQERFHDHIIRDGAEYQRIYRYIKNNPLNWESDKFFGP